MIQNDLVLDLVPKKTPQIVHVTQYDNDREIPIRLTYNGSPFVCPAGYSVCFIGQRPSGETFDASEFLNLNGSSGFLHVTALATIEYGVVRCGIYFSNGINRIGPATFLMFVHKTSYTEGDTLVPIESISLSEVLLRHVDNEKVILPIVSMSEDGYFDLYLTDNGIDDHTLYAIVEKDYSSQTTLKINLTSAKAITLYYTQSSPSATKIDWGDGAETTPSSTRVFGEQHNYQSAGEYIITIRCQEGETWSPGVTVSSSEYYTLLGKFSEKIGTRPELVEAYLGNNVRLTSEYAFGSFNGLTTVVIDEGTTTIPKNCFYSCSKLASITFPDTLERIQSNAFQTASSLEQVVIPKNVVEIANGAFIFTLLKTISFKPLVPPTLGSSFYNVFFTLQEHVVYVPSESYELYTSAPNYSEAVEKMQPE